MFKQPIGRAIVFSLFFLLPLSASGTPAQPSPPPGVTLEQAYQKALVISETLQISDQDIEQLRALYRQGVGTVFPHLSWQMTQFWQDTSGVSQSSGGVQGTLLRERRPESYFLIEQPLFHGLRDYNAVKGIKAAEKGAELNRKQAELNLLTDVADVFYTAYDLQQELEALGSQYHLTEDRLSELQKRVRLGRSRDSEVLSSEVELASLDAQMEDTRQRLHVARQVLQFLTAVPPSTPLVEYAPAPKLPPLEAAHSKSAGRPDLLAAVYYQETQKYALRYAKGGYYPGLDLAGKYYTERVGFNEDIKWDALLSLDVPIFTGFTTKNEVREAKSKQLVADLQFSRLKRRIAQEVESAHQSLRYSASQTEYYSKAVRLAERNYKSQVKEYGLGLINNIQVFDVLTDLQDLRIRKIRVEALTRLNDIKLRVATGQGLQ